MSREILFRAKKVDGGEWVEGYIVKKQGTYFLYDINNSDTCRQNNYLIDEDTICQYTGLTDWNGEKIWENDIFKCRVFDKHALIKYGTYQIGFDSRVFTNVGLYANWLESSSVKLRKDLGYWVNVEEIEIIGNIFDNPELLEEEGIMSNNKCCGTCKYHHHEDIDAGWV